MSTALFTRAMEVKSYKETQCLLNTLKHEFASLGFEFHLFKVGWYNSVVRPVFALDYDEDTVSVLIISTPDMFEKAFIPFIQHDIFDKVRDPIDECMIFHLSKLPEIFPHCGVKVIHDFELHPNRRPKMLMQTAAHVSGAAYFYQKKDFKEDCWKNQKIYGVCIHPKYGGWFAIRGVAIFSNVRCPTLPRVSPVDVIISETDKIALLEKYNFNWKDWTFRDVIPVTQKYSKEAVNYFSTVPSDRMKFIEEMINSSVQRSGS